MIPFLGTYSPSEEKLPTEEEPDQPQVENKVKQTDSRKTGTAYSRSKKREQSSAIIHSQQNESTRSAGEDKILFGQPGRKRKDIPIAENVAQKGRDLRKRIRTDGKTENKDGPPMVQKTAKRRYNKANAPPASAVVSRTNDRACKRSINYLEESFDPDSNIGDNPESS